MRILERIRTFPAVRDEVKSPHYQTDQKRYRYNQLREYTRRRKLFWKAARYTAASLPLYVGVEVTELPIDVFGDLQRTKSPAQIAEENTEESLNDFMSLSVKGRLTRMFMEPKTRGVEARDSDTGEGLHRLTSLAFDITNVAYRGDVQLGQACLAGSEYGLIPVLVEDAGPDTVLPPRGSFSMEGNTAFIHSDGTDAPALEFQVIDGLPIASATTRDTIKGIGCNPDLLLFARGDGQEAWQSFNLTEQLTPN